jgi:hypothetical protein
MEGVFRLSFSGTHTRSLIVGIAAPRSRRRDRLRIRLRERGVAAVPVRYDAPPLRD